MLPNQFFHITLHTLTSQRIFSKLFSMMLTRRICFKFNNQELISLVIISFILVTFLFDIRGDIVRRNYVLAILSLWKFTVRENTCTPLHMQQCKENKYQPCFLIHLHNPLHLNISLYFLPTVLYTFPEVPIMRICVIVKRFLCW